VSDAIVEDYLRRITAAAADLPADRRDELVAGIREHIEAARSSGQVPDEASLRDLLDRLGDPEEIVATAREDAGPAVGAASTAVPAPPPVLRYRRPSIAIEVVAVVLLTIGSIIPIIGWLAGVIVAWTSRRWTTGEKLLATLVFPGGPFLALWLVTLVTGTSSTCSSSATIGPDGNSVQGPQVCTTTGASLPPALGIPLLVLLVVAPIAVAILLIVRARRRADAEPPIPVYAGEASGWGGLEIAAVLLLAVGGFVVPFAGPLAGLVCAWISPRWTTVEKTVATLIAGIGLVLPALVLLVVVSHI